MSSSIHCNEMGTPAWLCITISVLHEHSPGKARHQNANTPFVEENYLGTKKKKKRPFISYDNYRTGYDMIKTTGAATKEPSRKSSTCERHTDASPRKSNREDYLKLLQGHHTRTDMVLTRQVMSRFLRSFLERGESFVVLEVERSTRA